MQDSAHCPAGREPCEQPEMGRTGGKSGEEHAPAGLAVELLSIYWRSLAGSPSGHRSLAQEAAKLMMEYLVSELT